MSPSCSRIAEKKAGSSAPISPGPAPTGATFITFTGAAVPSGGLGERFQDLIDATSNDGRSPAQCSIWPLAKLAYPTSANNPTKILCMAVFGMIVFEPMVQALAIALIVVLVALRIMLPPVPGMLKAGFQRWGMRNTILLCSVSLVCAGVAIFLFRH